MVFQEYIKAFLLIFFAELGDKTQILAMAFATRYSVKKVLLGIFIGSLLNHSLAVILGKYLSEVIPLNVINVVAGFVFIFFALWTLKSDEDEEDEGENLSRFNVGPVLTVAMAFFIGELGDKTQLTAITLASEATYALAVLAGTVSGMVVTGGLGIVVGKQLGNKISKFKIKVIASSVFLIFGLIKLYETLPREYLSLGNIVLFFIVLSVLIYSIIKPKLRKESKEN